MLYLVATPIGNLNDITLRALSTLREVDIIASEDTRKTGLLLKHFAISKPQIAFHEHNEERAGQQLEDLLKQGKSVALVTRSEEHTSELQSPCNLVCRLLLEKKKTNQPRPR